MKPPRLRANRLISLEVEEDGFSKLYDSRIEQVALPYVTAFLPTERLAPIIFPPGKRVKIWAWKRRALFSLPTAVVGQVTKPSPWLLLEVVGPWERVERRTDVRLELALRPLEAWFLTEGDEPHPVEMILENISAGGARVRLRGLLAEEIKAAMGLGKAEPARADNGSAKLRFKFALGGKAKPIEVTAKIRWLRLQMGNDEGWAHGGVEFLDLKRKDADQIFRFIFAEQLERRRRGEL